MNRVFVNISSDLSNVPNLEQLLLKEQATVGKWKAEGIVDHLFIKENGKGAILVFEDVNEIEVKQLIPTLPLSKYFENIEYIPLEKVF